MVTGNMDADLARSCLRLGAFDYIMKPVNLKKLGEVIKTRLFMSGKK